MKKITGTILTSSLLFSALGVSFAQTTTSSSVKKNLDVACIQSAIEKREATLSSGISALNSSITAALSTRKEALKVAVTLPSKTEMYTARKTANAAFDKSVKSARTTMKSTREKAWSTYKTEARSCGQKEVEAPTATESAL